MRLPAVPGLGARDASGREDWFPKYVSLCLCLCLCLPFVSVSLFLSVLFFVGGWGVLAGGSGRLVIVLKEKL